MFVDMDAKTEKNFSIYFNIIWKLTMFLIEEQPYSILLICLDSIVIAAICCMTVITANWI